MSDIKAGDLVMAVKPMACCGSTHGIGSVFVSGEVSQGWVECACCGADTEVESALIGIDDSSCVETYRLKKIDPPAEGDSLPTRKDLGVPA